MAQRRWLQTATRHALPLLSSKSTTSLKPLPHLPAPISLKSLLSPKPLQQFLYNDLTLFHTRSFSSISRDDSENEEDDGEEGEEEEEDYDSDNNEAEVDDVTVSNMKREYSAEEKEAEAAAIGYKVIEPLLPSDRVFKNREPVFAVVQVGSHQFKVSNGDCIYVERLKFCEVNDKLILNKVLMLGTSTQTIIGRPILPDAAVHAVVEEHISLNLKTYPTNYTWAWRKVLKLRRIAWYLIDLVVGNGRNVAVIVNNEWCWPNACLEPMVEVQRPCSLVHPLSDDLLVQNLTLDDQKSIWNGFSGHFVGRHDPGTSGNPKTKSSGLINRCYICGVVRSIGDWVNELQWGNSYLQKKCFLSSLLRLAWCAVILLHTKIPQKAINYSADLAHALALDAKVIIFKKKRRKNYRRTKGHRQELTRLRIADIQGIEIPEPKVDPKPKRAAVKQQEKVAVAA
ncbi:hypothetical protein SADUNF_Sadunf15G0083400 [Salix dunnii]|uniref:Large ribosomal subunit protein bL21m n=1 Tax=Salix dunnii TaxID=1413687 RepID=A0A835JEN3_9ROSI|nr:hypothetical protein SADUNF_Sadunf15G0083400 [Salix dunnii]